MRWNKLEVECIEVGKPDVTVYRLSGGLTGSPESYQFLENLRNQTRKHPSPLRMAVGISMLVPTRN